MDGEKVTDIAVTFEKTVFEEDGIVLKKGKKNFRKIILK